tara:strand:- start:665 stop:1636 length:972 start_codon:yes stop_codon:yes gene_type:complete
LKILITGTAGFIGFSLAKKLLTNNKLKIYGFDNLNNYYDVNLKKKRLSILKKYKNYTHFKVNIQSSRIEKIFNKFRFDVVVNLAAQAGVRYSMTNPKAYIQTNQNGFFNIIENSKKYDVKKFLYASSSSVYGRSKKQPSKESQNVDFPESLYAATKKSNELVAYYYSKNFNFNTIGLRFFTVYGPWGRPDMALFKFTRNILENRSINVFNYGKHFRDFTYIDDVTECVKKIILSKNRKKNPMYEVLNIGNNKPVYLMDFIKEVEKNICKKAKIKFLPLQKGDVIKTYANINLAKKNYGYNPKIKIQKGVKLFIDWYKNFYAKH